MKFKLKILKTYTGVHDLDSALKDPQSKKLLWLEILFNDLLNWEAKFTNPLVKKSYRKASVWYYHFRTMIGRSIKRKPLKKFQGKWDEREYRLFIKTLNFVSP